MRGAWSGARGDDADDAGRVCAGRGARRGWVCVFRVPTMPTTTPRVRVCRVEPMTMPCRVSARVGVGVGGVCCSPCVWLRA